MGSAAIAGKSNRSSSAHGESQDEVVLRAAKPKMISPGNGSNFTLQHDHVSPLKSTVYKKKETPLFLNYRDNPLQQSGDRESGGTKRLEE